MYRLDLVRELDLSWQPAPGHPTGSLLYYGLADAGYDAVRLPPDEMHACVEHVAHATALLGRGGLGHWRGNAKVRRAMRRIMGSDLARQLAADRHDLRDPGHAQQPIAELELTESPQLQRAHRPIRRAQRDQHDLTRDAGQPDVGPPPRSPGEVMQNAGLPFPERLLPAETRDELAVTPRFSGGVGA